MLQYMCNVIGLGCWGKERLVATLTQCGAAAVVTFTCSMHVIAVRESSTSTLYILCSFAYMYVLHYIRTYMLAYMCSIPLFFTRNHYTYSMQSY